MTLALFMELLVKSGLIAGAGLALSWTLSFRPARDRVDVLRAASVLVVLLPLAVVVAPRLPLALLAPAQPITVSVVEPWRVDLAPVVPVALSGDAPMTWPLTLIGVALYLLVAALLAGRFLMGVWTLGRWTRSGRAVRTGAWAETLARLDPPSRAGKGARLVASPRVEGPLSWGLPPGVVLIGDDSLRREDQARAVLAHELAHIRRRDWIFLAVSRLAVALFWFNPLVWWLHHELSARTEDAADAAAVADIEPGAYARALLDFASDTASPAALALGGDYRSLKKRIARIMTVRKTLPRRPLFVAAAVAALAAVATPIAAVELTRREAPEAAAAPLAIIFGQEPAPPAPEAPTAPTAPLAPEAPTRAWVHVGDVNPQVHAEVRASVEAAREHAAAAREQAAQVRAEASARREQAAAAREQAAAARAEASRHRHEAARIRAEAIASHYAPPAPPAPPAHPARFAHPAPPAPPASLSAEARVQARASARAAARADAVSLAAIAEAREAADAARVEARAAMAQARVEMGRGADEMDRGAREMRQEAIRLRDPAYRAQVIADNRARGQSVTDDQLVALSRTMPAQADRMVRDAARMRQQAARGI